jgi:hypothetical protein
MTSSPISPRRTTDRRRILSLFMKIFHGQTVFTVNFWQSLYTVLSTVFGHTHSAYTHLAGTYLSGYHVEVLKIIRHPHLKGEQVVDEITGQLVDRSDQKRPSVPFTLSTNDSYLIDPGHLEAILNTLKRELTAGSSPITLVYLNAPLKS